jgi:hypothetical protein
MGSGPRRFGATVRWDGQRAWWVGLAAAVPNGLVLIAAVQVHHAGPLALALIAAAAPIGFLLAPLAHHLIATAAIPAARAYAWLLLLAAIAWLVVGAWPTLPVLVAGTIIAQGGIATCMPMITAYWRQNSADRHRGRWFARNVQVEAVAGVAGAVLVAWIVRDAPQRYAVPAFGAGACLLLAARAAWRIPSASPSGQAGRNPLASLAWLWRDPRFGHVSLSWMLMGFANFAALPLRVEYLASSERGMGYSAAVVQLLVAGLPAIARLATLRLWGSWFDRHDIIALRCAINLCFAVAIACLFTSSLTCQIIGSLLCGVGFGGGDLAWSLWVTRFAPPERTGSYMSAHVFLTGIRGVVAPLLGFHLVRGMGASAIAGLAIALIAVATAMLLPGLRRAPAGSR